MTTRIRTLNFLPEIFQTTTNAQFLAASLDQIVDQPMVEKIEGYIGSKFGYGINAKDHYVTEPTKVRKDYQLDPGVVFTKPNESVAQDFISYPGIIDALKMEGAITNNNDRLFNSQFYSWDSFTNLDKIINFNQYYWLPEGPAAVEISTDTVFSSTDYIVTDLYNGYSIVPTTATGFGTTNPTITLLRGGTYSFAVNQNSEFWIQGVPGVTGYSPSQPNLSTRDILGVENNGAKVGIVTFTVPSKNAQDNYNLPGNNLVDVISNIPFNTLNGSRVAALPNGVDDVTSLNGLTVMFYNTGIPYEAGYISTFYDTTNFDVNSNLIAPKTISVTGTTAGTNAVTCDSTANLTVGNTVTFSGVGFGGLKVYQPGPEAPVNAGSFTIGQEYAITSVGNTDWISIGLQGSAVVDASITGTVMTVNSVTSGELQIGQTIQGSGVTAGTTIVSYDLEVSLTSGNPTYIVSISQTVPSTTITGYDIIIGKLFTATGVGSGSGIATPNLNYIYYVKQILNSTDFVLANVLDGSEVQLVTDSGSLIGNINQGLYEEGYYTNVNDYFYTINYVGPVDDPIISLTPGAPIPTSQKITALYGTQWNSRNFFKNSVGSIEIVPFISAPLDTLYYQDGTSSNKVGIIKIVESNILNTLDVESDILGKKTFTSTTGVKFTNGLKVTFQGAVVPEKYKSNQYYVEGVGTAIELIPVTDMIVPETFTTSTYIPWDTTPWDIGNWEGNSYIPVTPDYITIARNSIDKNAWSRSNRWFHIDVINATAEYNNTPEYVSLAATKLNKAKRPIIEFYPNLKLFNSGSEGKHPVDFVDERTTDAFTLVAGQQNYYPDVAVYTAYTAEIQGTNYSATRTVTNTSSVNNALTCDSTVGFRVNDIVTFAGFPLFGGVSPIDTYYVKDILSSTEFTIATEANGATVPLTTDSGTMTCSWIPQSTQITILETDIVGNFALGQYIADSTNILPRNTRIIEISGTSTITLTVSWNGSTDSMFPTTTGASLISTDTTVDNYALFDGCTIVFAADTDLEVRNKVFLVSFSQVTTSSPPVITLTKLDDGDVLADQQTVTLRGYFNKGKDFYFDGSTWIGAQQKIKVNQPPLFDIFDANGISLGNSDVYVGTSFAGTTLFSYGLGSGLDDSILGFPIKYSSVNNVGDISFDVTLNSDTFTYVQGSKPIIENIGVGYVYQYLSRTTHTRQIGWQTAVSPSIQYQVFEFDYSIENPTDKFVCDIAPVASGSTKWPTVQVYVNNVIQPSDNYTISTTDNSTTIELLIPIIENTIVQVLVYSDQVSNIGYYQIPINLNNNPLNENVTTVNVGDIRGQYQSIFVNNPDCTGEVFGSNNMRDLGNVVPWGNKIIQNSASLVLPGTFLRKQDHNLFNALAFNSREYVKFKNLLVDVINNTDYQQRVDPATMLDAALDQITSTKTDSQAFFWSDMLPSKVAYITNIYSFANSLDTSIYPLSRIYDFNKANYYSLLVYLTRTVNNIVITKQLLKGIDYIVSEDAPSLTMTKELLPGDKVTIKEYNQTYGSYVPNTPTKLGMYPSFVPEVILDSNYSTPTYFIKGHDGSYNKLYGTYDPVTGLLEDFRDQTLLEYELRVFNNLKLSAESPINLTEILPGFFRDTDYSYNEWLEMYSTTFLNWVGQNRIDYKRHIYNSSNAYTYNYWQSGNKINKKPIEIGFWRGIYQYFYDTSTPDLTPWEMLGINSQPDWWETRYGPAPYTSDNLILWNDLAQGINWNNGNPIVIDGAIRPELLSALPVNSAGDLLPPIESVVGSYNANLFQREWKVGDCGPAEFSYRRSSSYPFDLMRLFALMKPTEFFNLAVDLDNYKFNTEFNQYLVNDRSHLIISDVEIYGTGTAKTSYINWIVDYEKQLGIPATENLTTLLDNLDVRLVYRLAGFSDKTLLKFYVEKGTPNSRNASLLIPDESYSVLLYDNQPFDRIVYSGLVIQLVNGGYAVFGNSQTSAYFNIANPKTNGNTDKITVEKLTVKIYNEYYESKYIVPYGTTYFSAQEVAQFIAGYGAFLENQGVKFEQQENGLEVNWKQMVAEFLYWAQTGWQEGSVITLNPAAKVLAINKDNAIVQPIVGKNNNFVLNQNLYPIQNTDLNIVRDGVEFIAKTLNEGDTIAYGQFNLGNFEHGIVFDNVTLFNDVIYNLSTGLRQTRIAIRGTKSADWNGTVDASGFIYNQDNVKEWTGLATYTKGEIVKYKNKYWTALTIVQPSTTFLEKNWVRTDYDQIQTGLLPNSSTRSYESSMYYDVNKANLESDADLLSFSLIGYRPRDYLALVDLTDITQVNVYKNLIKSKGTLNAAKAFKGANLPQGGIDYDIYENWAIKSGDFGGVLNSNFVEVKLQQTYLSGNPSTVGLTNGFLNEGVQQDVPLYNLFNYGRPVTNTNVLPIIDTDKITTNLPSAGYVNFNDVKLSSYFYEQLSSAKNASNIPVPLSNLYVRDYMWIANFLEKWQVFTPTSLGRVVRAVNNLNRTVTVQFEKPHNLKKYDTFAVINFNQLIDNYYVATLIPDPYTVIVPYVLNVNFTSLSGSGIGLKFTSQRVEQPSDIINLNLLDSEFIKNTVWVDTDNTGSWGVYRKSIAYQHQSELLGDANSKLGYAVATSSQLGYLVSAPDLGEVYRYNYNSANDQYKLMQTITQGDSFGSCIAHADDIYVISEPSSGTPKVHIYQLVVDNLTNELVQYQSAISAPANSINWGSALAISGDKNWLYISDYDNTVTPNTVYVYRKSQLTDEYEFSTTVTLAGLAATDNFGYSLSTNYYGDQLVIGTPNINVGNIENYGNAYVFTRTVQNIEAQYTSENVAQQFTLIASPTVTVEAVTGTDGLTNTVICSSTSGLTVNDPVMFYGTPYLGSEILPEVVYYVHSVVDGTHFKIKETRDAVIEMTLGTSSGTGLDVYVQTEPIFVSVNGTLVDNSNYGVVNGELIYSSPLNAGDILNVSLSNFTYAQTLTAGEATPRIGVKFGTSVSNNISGSEIVVGAPFELSPENQEGAVHRFTNAGSKYGIVYGIDPVNITSISSILINGYLVQLPIGNATVAASAINAANITNVSATAIDGKIAINLVDQNLGLANQKLSITSIDSSVIDELGIQLFTETQIVRCPHKAGRTQFGLVVKFNERDSILVSAPAGTRYVSTTFDFVDDENQDGDTIFDNNATNWIDTFENAGAVYLFDYLSNYNENLTNPGKFVYAQSTNSLDQTYGSQPQYGSAIDFCDNQIIVGASNLNTGSINGQFVTYINTSGVKNWSLFRTSSEVVDINRISNILIYSAQTNNTLINIDYFDPLQGKLLGVVRENIDVIASVDPAVYNTGKIPNGVIWGASHIGQIWFNTKNVKYVNYHQSNDIVYNSKYWGTVFPNSDVAVYTWIESAVPPNLYSGPGTPYDVNLYSTQYVLNPSNTLTPIYYFWVRDTNIVFSKEGKTLADKVIAGYIANPQNSGITYFSPLLSNVFGLYNAGEYINANDSILHIGYATGTNDDVSHAQYEMIRANFDSDFLPGVPTTISGNPESLYDRLLDSLCGVDEVGEVVPNPYLPKSVQYGIQVRPRQSFFVNRFKALENYLQYANEILSLYPITEIRQASFLDSSGEFYNTADYWEYINWWAVGYNDNTKAAIQVSIYAELATLTVSSGTIVSVAANGNGKTETYILESTGEWRRIGLENGTVRFKSSLWDYSAARLGFGDNFFDTAPYDVYPSEETRKIVRALNEQIYTQDLLIYRNKSLILLFEYIQSETIESQNYLPWLNKTSFIDVAHTIRELRPIEVFQTDNQDFLSGYINEIKPYRVVIKEFLFKYTGSDVYQGRFTDFDLPATYSKETETFITPELVYSNPNTSSQFLPTDSIWTKPEYTEWFANKGVSLTGELGVQITKLESYIALNANSFSVDNAQGLPINGIMLIDNEQIGYSNVDRALNVVSGLTRGVNGTEITTHNPGSLIYMDLPPVLLLDGGRSYSEPPRVTAYIDPLLYPAPTRPAVLSAVMNLDSILRIDVIDPGQGYAVLPKIIIDPSTVITFASTDVNTLVNTIQLYAPVLQTGDLVQYKRGVNGTTIGGLANDQWYYVNVLETTPTVTIALYASYIDAVNDSDRIVLFNQGSGTQHTLSLGGKASAISSALPVRENNITLRFDRTSYKSNIIDWIAGNYYGAYYAGTYSNSESVASSSIQLQSTQPPIGSILASAQGISFEITDAKNVRTVEYSSLARRVYGTFSGTDAIRLIPLDDGSNNPNASGTTIGFYVGMPIQFRGAVVSNIQNEVTYYVHSIISNIDFTISTVEGGDPLGSPLTLTTTVVGTAGLECFTGNVLDVAVISVNYPGISKITNTTAGTNYLTIPLNPTGTGGTTGFYVGLPVFFTGTMLGGVRENQMYYITTVIDKQTFTMSESNSPTTVNITQTSSSGNLVTIDDDAQQFNINEPIIVNNMTVSGIPTNNFGNIVSGKTYYVVDIPSGNQLQLSETINGEVLALSNSTGTALLTSQSEVIQLTTDSGSDMVINVSLPVSPGQVNGQQFTLYQTSVQYPNLTGTAGELISESIGAVISGDDIVGLIGDVSNMYVNMPVTVSADIGSLVTSTTYYVTEIDTISIAVTSTTSSGNLINCDSTASLYIDMPIIFFGTGIGELLPNVEYYVHSIINGTQFSITSTPNGTIITQTTANGSMTGEGTPYVKLSTSIGGPVVNPGNSQQVATISIGASATITVAASPANGTRVEFRTSGSLPSGMSTGTLYYVRNSTGTTFNISLTPAGPLITTSGSQSGIQYAILKDDYELIQTVTSVPVFDISFILGGSRAIIVDAADGFAIGNIITILGSDVGGTTPTNDVVLTVTEVGANGEILGVSSTGDSPVQSNKYYLKVISANEFEVYSNPLMTVPVTGINFPYVGITSTTAYSTTVTTNIVTVEDTSDFNLYDPVVFTGDVIGGLELGITYYILTIPNTTSLTVSTIPGDISTVVSLTTDTSSGFLMAKQGSLALLPEPFSFNQSIVKYNNRVYMCIISNNDTEFIFGKWELLSPSDRRLNALDRILGYYQPTDDMPGTDLAQLVDNITYPNSTYLDNAFAPEDQFELDVILKDQQFYPTQLGITSILWNGVNYLGTVNTGNYSGIITNSGNNWNIKQLSNVDLVTKSVIYSGGKYLLGTNNLATPIIRSIDGLIWSTSGTLITLDGVTHDSVTNRIINSIVHYDKYAAVGDCILTSSNGVDWVERLNVNSDPALYNLFNEVAVATLPGFTGYIAVGKGQHYDYSTGLTMIYPNNLVFYSTNAIDWFSTALVSLNGFNSVASNTDRAIAVGENGVIYYSENGSNWLGINETTVTSVNSASNVLNVGSTIGFFINDQVIFTSSFNTIVKDTVYYVVNIPTLTQIQISTTLGGSPITLNSTNPTTVVYMDKYPTEPDLNAIHYANNIFVTVGESGTIRTSPDGLSWTTQTSGVVTTLNAVNFNQTDSIWIVSGENNTILTSADNGVTWESSAIFVTDPTFYNIQGSPFEYGYGPEELVAGVVTDNLNMIVNTRPGTNWDATQYAHVGYNVVSLELTPESGTQTVYSFKDAVTTPTQLAVWQISSSTELGIRLYEPSYTVNWVEKTITLATPLPYLPTDKLRIDVYEVGNGDQLVKASTDTDPILTNSVTGFNEIVVNCNYSDTIFNGSGIIRPGTQPKDVIVTETESITDTIQCEDVTGFVVNDPITFQGTTFGGILEDTTYYVKSISYVTNRITVSATYNIGAGTAGPTFSLSDGTGLMYAIIQVGSGTVWTSPIINHNGSKLLLGATGTVTRTTAANNAVTCNTTSGMILGSDITFSNTIFGGVIQPMVKYKIFAIHDANEFVLEDPLNPGNPLALTNATGGATFITNDYAFGIANNGVSAKIMFSTDSYLREVDYISYTLFGETTPIQYGYTLPETEMFTGDGVTDVFNLTNYLGGSNADNAVVEINGLRISDTLYTISSLLNTITFVTPPALNEVIAVTTINSTDRQYLFTQYDVTGKTVAKIVAINNSISAPLVVTVSATDGTTDRITCSTTTGFVSGQPILFKGTSFGGILTDGTYYFVGTIVDGFTFTIVDELGATINLSTATGLIVAYVGGVPAVRITTELAHGFVDNDIVRIDGTSGSIQLNNQLFYVKKVSSVQFDLYEYGIPGNTGYNPAYAAVNFPIVAVSTYSGGGFTWKFGTYNIIDTAASATSTDPILGNRITVSSTSTLVVGTPVYFSETGVPNGTAIMGGIIAGTEYYIKEVFGVNEFSISSIRGGEEFVLSNDSGTMYVTQWAQENVDRLWVTINGYRVPSSSLKLNAPYLISILHEITTGDNVTITSMMPSATPNEECYMLSIDKYQVPTVHRSNTRTRTWLTHPLYNTDDVIHVADVTRVTDTVITSIATPTAISGVHSVGINGDKRILSSITVFNNTTGQIIAAENWSLSLVDLSPIVNITSGAWINTGDLLTITVLEGNLIYLNGEKIKFTSVNLANNTLSGLQRGANGTGEQTLIPAYTEVFGILSSNLLPESDYNETWNSNIYNTVDGDPLQISNTPPAIFLLGDEN